MSLINLIRNSKLNIDLPLLFNAIQTLYLSPYTLNRFLCRLYHNNGNIIMLGGTAGKFVYLTFYFIQQ